MTVLALQPVAAARLSRRAMATPEPLVRAFARRVQQEGALDLTHGDYKNADFAPHAEVVRAAQRITRNSVHSYGPAVGRLDLRAEIAELVNRDGVRDYPGTSVRFLPDEVIFTPGTRSGLRKRVDYRLDAWPHPASKAEPAALTLAAIEAMIGLERLRGGKGA